MATCMNGVFTSGYARPSILTPRGFGTQVTGRNNGLSAEDASIALVIARYRSSRSAGGDPWNPLTARLSRRNTPVKCEAWFNRNGRPLTATLSVGILRISGSVTVFG